MKTIKKIFPVFFMFCFGAIKLFAGDDKPVLDSVQPVQKMEQKIVDNKSSEASETLVLDLKTVIFDSILGQSFWDSKDQILALSLDNEIRAKYDLQEFDKLKLLIEKSSAAQKEAI